MTYYLIILAAVIVGAAIGLILASTQRKNETVLVEEGKAKLRFSWLLVLGVLVMLLVGLFLLVDYDRASIDSRYTPAQSDDKSLIPGQFN